MNIQDNKNFYKNNMKKPTGDYGGITNTIFDFYELEKLYRKGFMMNKVGRENCQTVAEHTAAVSNLALLVMLEYNMDLDTAKVMQMAAVHEYGEIIIGDITPFDGITPEQKHIAEEEALREVLGNLENGSYIYKLWQEFEEKETREAKFVFDMDKLEAALNALRYKESLGKNQLYRFYSTTLAMLNYKESKEVLKKAWQNRL